MNAREVMSVKWWFPAGIKPEDMITLRRLDDILPFLRQVPLTVVHQLLVSLLFNFPT